MSLTVAVPRREDRCEIRAARRGDPMLGTAFPAARLLLVEQPYPWGPEGLRTSRFDREAAHALEASCRQHGVRVQAIRRPGRDPGDRRRRWATVDTRDGSTALRWGEFSRESELLELPLDGSAGEADPLPLVLVCTHGRHDPCCGGRGRPVLAAFAALRPDRVWQAGHLGGCRFAATVLVLPLGMMYGRVAPDAARTLLADADAGEVTVPLLRGRIGIAPAAQAAVGFAHERLALPRRDDVMVESVTVQPDGTVRTRVRTPRGRVDVDVSRERIDASGLTCAAPGPSWFVAHRPVAIEPVSEDRG